MTDLASAHVLVLGATGGLGSAIARRLVASGARVSVSGRDGARLEALADELGTAVVTVVAADLTMPDGPASVVRAASADAALTGVVNAAGVVAFGTVEDLDDDTLDEVLLLDLVAPIRLARAALAVIPEGGFLAQVSAVVAEKAMPGMAAYSAAKAGLTAFDAALATELRRRRIRVLDVRPPHTETGLATRPVAGEAPRLPQGLDPDAVAERVVRALADEERDLPSTAFTA
ncbi:short-chain dehydrogenase [Terrabacter sp. Root85]|uniref:SDR family NAD(P)-dependent oxidoreductase n=1 Tax=unclassified Terrabacter TaxID=2630222 RepID=UPI0006F62588|nr:MULTISPECIES: SDR family NAD(P)-dependent oxidoreductase [unclassified Terrabacter]KRC88626.1 short-chain dehydrogenase [Terrabacter sp. Root85]KRF45899.1 short-chain dehydrogenase [Terrabacter sp. Soil811]